MTSDDVTRQFIAEAKRGRGLWAGVFLDSALPTVDGFEIHSVPADTPDGRSTTEPDKPTLHTTLVHFGRDNSEWRVRAILAACERVMVDTHGEIRAKSWGLARMDQSKTSVVTLLLEGSELADLAGRLRDEANERGVLADRRFEFHPHVTLRTIESLAIAQLPRFPRVELVFRRLVVVCGDARTAFAPGPPPF